MIVNMCEINRKQNYHFRFGHQFVNSIQNVTCTVIQPRRMFNKMCYGSVCGSSLNWYVPVLYAIRVLQSRYRMGYRRNAVARGLWHKYEP